MEIIDKLSNIGILTGSRKFGYEKDDSDYDFIITEELAKPILEKYEWKSCNIKDDDIECSPQEYEDSIFGGELVDIVKFKSDDKTINLFIFETNTVYPMFDKVNKIIMMFDDISDKSKRIDKWIKILILVGITDMGVPIILNKQDDFMF